MKSLFILLILVYSIFGIGVTKMEFKAYPDIKLDAGFFMFWPVVVTIESFR